VFKGIPAVLVGTSNNWSASYSGFVIVIPVPIKLALVESPTVATVEFIGIPGPNTDIPTSISEWVSWKLICTPEPGPYEM